MVLIIIWAPMLQMLTSNSQSSSLVVIDSISRTQRAYVWDERTCESVPVFFVKQSFFASFFSWALGDLCLALGPATVYA